MISDLHGVVVSSRFNDLEVRLRVGLLPIACGSVPGDRISPREIERRQHRFLFGFRCWSASGTAIKSRQKHIHMKVIFWLVAVIVALAIAVIIFMSLALGGSKDVFSEDVSNQHKVHFPITVDRTLGNPVKHLLIGGMEDTNIAYRITITNRSTQNQWVSRHNVDNSNEGEMVSLAPKETKLVFSGVGQGAGIVLSDLSSNSRDLFIEIDFDRPPPTGTRLHARLVLADGP